MQYVKVIDGKIVEGPKELSASESDSPNSHWSDQQLKLNNIILVDTTHNPLTEKVDYSNPVITKDSVSFPVITLSLTDQTTLLNKEAIKGRLSEYLSIQDLTVALWEQIIENRPDSATAIQLIRTQIKKKYPKI